MTYKNNLFGENWGFGGIGRKVAALEALSSFALVLTLLTFAPHFTILLAVANILVY